MLLLSRKTGEKVEAVTKDGEVIEVMVSCIRPGRVILGFKAAKSVAIIRSEAKKVATSDGDG